MNEISIITPVYNEQDNIIPFVNKIQEVMNRINQSYELIFIFQEMRQKLRPKIYKKASRIVYYLFIPPMLRSFSLLYQ